VRHAVPQAAVQERYRILLDGFAVGLPWRSLPALTRLAAVRKVYPSVGYLPTAEGGPSVISADRLQAATGDGGQGVKIAVVDTGVDPANPFLRPAGFTYPQGFPRGDRRLTTPKVIVARVFPGPLRDRRSNQAFDPSEPHGTHVAGIAAGDAGTAAPAGPDHPAVGGLSGVAPRAWIGNYRVFTIPTPLGHEADTPEIVAAFEAAAADGMNVVNFSGGGPQIDPENDALVQAVHNLALAGVVPVIAAGNDRDDFGLGTTGSPATAPDAIAVAAVSNAHVFAPALAVVGAPPSLTAVPVQPAGGERLPPAWSATPQPIVDVTSLTGSDGRPLDPRLCGPADDPNGALGTVRKGSLAGAVVLAWRGACTFASKAARASYAGATGLILVDNRPGEANPIPVPLGLPAAMISDLDGAHLHAFLAGTGGRARFRVSSGIEEIPTGRSGVITSFSSAGPTDFGGALKPDLAAPGLDVLSSTPPQTTGSTFAVFAGTSMATPHVAGAAALLLQRHPGWTPWNVKSALMSTAAPAWGDTARTHEASVLLEGAGLADVLAADDPRLFTDPQSLSFGRIDAATAARHAAALLTVTDAGGGAGDWSVTVAPQAQTDGTQIEVPPAVSLPPGGDVSLPVDVRVGAGASPGEDDGFVVLSRGGVERRVPYAFLVERPALASLPARPLERTATGSTATGSSRVSQYCCPSEPFGPPPDYTGAPMDEAGSEHLFSLDVEQPVANIGVAVLEESVGALVDPFVLGSKDENDVQGYAGTPTDVNPLTVDYQADVGAAGAQFPRLRRFYVAVDSRADPFTDRPQNGRYVLHAWVNDVVPPALRMLTTRVATGRPLLVGRAVDRGSGVDPLSLVLNYDGVLVGASAYDPATGLAVFGLPPGAPPLRAGGTKAVFFASDFQESKNIDTIGSAILPNSTFDATRLHVVDGPAVTWLEPAAGGCLRAGTRLVVTASSPRSVRRVVFRDGDRTTAVVAGSPTGLYATSWRGAAGRPRLAATVVDAAGRSATARIRPAGCR
jgi:subtilisin family serine protease